MAYLVTERPRELHRFYPSDDTLSGAFTRKTFTNIGYEKYTETYHYIKIDDDGTLSKKTDKFFKINVPSRKGSIGRLIGLKCEKAHWRSKTYINNWRYEPIMQEPHVSFKVILRFDDEKKDVKFDAYQLSEVNATATNYTFIKNAKVKPVFTDKYNQLLEKEDLVICVHKRDKSIDFAKIVKFNTASISVKSIFNQDASGYFIRSDQLVKIDPTLSIETQIALLSISM